MSAVRPPYVRLFRDDVERVGRDAAHLLAVVRYVTGLPGEHNGRLWIDGEMWWSATYPELADAMGDISSQKVGRIVRKLEAEGELSCRQPDVWDGNQTKAYRIPDQPVFTSERQASARSSVNDSRSPVNRPRSPVNDPSFTSEHSSSPTEELIEEVEEIDYRASQAIARRDVEPEPEVVAQLLSPEDEAEVRAVRRAQEASKRDEVDLPGHRRVLRWTVRQAQEGSRP